MKFSSVVLWGLAVFSASASARGFCGCCKKEEQVNKAGGKPVQQANAPVKPKNKSGSGNVFSAKSPAKEQGGEASNAGNVQSTVLDSEKATPAASTSAPPAAPPSTESLSTASTTAPTSAKSGSSTPPTSTESLSTAPPTAPPSAPTSTKSGSSTPPKSAKSGSSTSTTPKSVIEPVLSLNASEVKPPAPPAEDAKLLEQLKGQLKNLQDNFSAANNSFTKSKSDYETAINEISTLQEAAIDAITAYNTAANEKKSNTELQPLKNDAINKINQFISKFDPVLSKFNATQKKFKSELENAKEVKAEITKFHGSLATSSSSDLKDSAQNLIDESAKLVKEIGTFLGQINMQSKQFQKDKNDFEAFKKVTPPNKKPDLSVIPEEETTTSTNVSPAPAGKHAQLEGAAVSAAGFAKNALSAVAAPTKSLLGGVGNLISQGTAALKGAATQFGTKLGDVASKFVFGLTPAQKLAEEQKKRHERFAVIPRALILEHYNQLLQILAEAQLFNIDSRELLTRLELRQSDLQQMIAKAKSLKVLSPQQENQFAELEERLQSIVVFLQHFILHNSTPTTNLIAFAKTALAQEKAQKSQKIISFKTAQDILEEAQKFNTSWFGFYELFKTASTPGQTLTAQQIQTLVNALNEFLNKQSHQLGQMLAEAQLIGIDLGNLVQRLANQENLLSYILPFFQNLNPNSAETTNITTNIQNRIELFQNLKQWVGFAANYFTPSLQLHQYLLLVAQWYENQIEVHQQLPSAPNQAQSQPSLNQLTQGKNQVDRTIKVFSGVQKLNQHIVEMQDLLISEEAAQQQQHLQNQYENLKSLLADNASQTKQVLVDLNLMWQEVNQMLAEPGVSNLPIAQELNERKKLLGDLYSVIKKAALTNFTLDELLKYVNGQLNQVKSQQLLFTDAVKEEEKRKLENVLHVLEEAKKLQPVVPESTPQQAQQQPPNVPLAANPI